MEITPQIPLDLSPGRTDSFTNFLVSECNVAAVKLVRAWPDWPAPILLLVGPKGSGKTHIGYAWASETGEVFIDNADAQDEGELFAIMNQALNGEIAGLLLASRRVPREWNIQIPDLKSRLVNTPLAILDEHDDAILEPVIRRLFEDKGRVVSQDLIAYLLKYQDRSIAAQREIVAELELAAQRQKADLTKAFAAKYLKRLSR